MQALMVTIKIKAGYRDAFMEAMLSDARGSVHDEPGCLRFDVLQDARDQNTLYLSLSRLNHWLPRGQTHPEVVQRTAEFHHQIANTLFPQADAVFE
jgi:hypothetical protein